MYISISFPFPVHPRPSIQGEPCVPHRVGGLSHGGRALVLPLHPHHTPRVHAAWGDDEWVWVWIWMWIWIWMYVDIDIDMDVDMDMDMDVDVDMDVCGYWYWYGCGCGCVCCPCTPTTHHASTLDEVDRWMWNVKDEETKREQRKKEKKKKGSNWWI